MNCDFCGLPRGVGKANTWEPNGVILSKYESDLRGALYDVEELDYIFSDLSERIGFDISPLVVEGKRKDSELYTRKLLGFMKDSGLEMPQPDEFFRIMAATYAIPGFGKISILDFSEDGSVTLAVERAYSRPMAEGQAAGVFEAVLGRRAEVSWEGDLEQGRVTLRAMEGESELERRMESEVEQAAPMVDEGDRAYELCPRCAAPLEVSREFDWDVGEARIIERRSGKRFIFDNVRGLNAVIHAIIEELGEDVESLISDISRLYARRYYRELAASTTLQEELARFALWGWGLPTDLREVEGGYTLRVLNSLYAPIMSGRIWGLLEVLGERELRPVESAETDGIVHLSFSCCGELEKTG